MAPATAAAQASLTVDPVQPCYRELSTVFLRASGFSPATPVVFTRDSNPVGSPIVTDGSGALLARLTLPGLVSGQRRLTYVATDSTNPALTASASLLVTATDVGMRPRRGAPHRLLTIRARGFFKDERGRGSNTLWAHILRVGRPARTARNLRIGRVQGPCRRVIAKRRLFPRDVAPGKYRVQFDTFRRYRPNRVVQTRFDVTLFRTAGTARVSAVSPAS
ncbi:MAG: hypothetical protein QOH58_309 [Thermoleophilaceae bacterium]|nr:hypothetical protein [Thermoleophilaceae bacterium]